MECKFCNKEYTNSNGLKNHEYRCKSNLNRIPSGFIEYNRTEKAETIRTSNNEKKRGKTYGEIYGEIKSKEISTLISNNSKRLKHSDESKDRISKSMMGNRNANHRGDRQSFYGNIRMDSSWEVKVAEYLDNNRYNWKYSSEKYILSTGQYLHPDFFIYDNIGNLLKIIEVKGYFRLKNREKFELFRKEYPHLVVELWDKNKLKELNLI